MIGSSIYNGNSNELNFGAKVRLSADGTIVAITNEYINGRAYIYKYDGQKWIKLGATLSSGLTNDGYGKTLNLSPDGLTVLVGAPDDSVSGRNAFVRMYRTAYSFTYSFAIYTLAFIMRVS